MINNCWLPKQEFLSDYKNCWEDYEAVIYSIFKKDFIDSTPVFDEKVVNIRKHPREFDKEEAFFHVTCKDYSDKGDRKPDLRRCERIRWVRSFIENYMCDATKCENCEGIKVWNEPYKSNERVHLLLVEERYIVIIEKRKTYCLLITAYYLDYDHSLKKQLKHYEKYKGNI